jgi:hypothetical protein
MKRRALLSLLALFACSRPPAKSPGSPTLTAPVMVAQFYATLMVDSVRGAPTGAELAKLSPMLSDTLRGLLKAARALHDADMASAPGDKPSFAEGDLFSSLFEGPIEVAALPDSANTSAERVLANLIYRSGKDTVRWVDTVVIGRRAGQPLVEDIRFGGSWDFGNKGTLRKLLEDALASVPGKR